jgi:hypothetical protein
MANTEDREKKKAIIQRWEDFTGETAIKEGDE